MSTLKRKRSRSPSNTDSITGRRPPPIASSSTSQQVTADKLLQLLDFTSLDSLSDISARFDVIADALLHDFVLEVRAPLKDAKKVEKEGERKEVIREYEILELEFYLFAPKSHEDPFTHGSEEQKKSGCWYFHRAPKRSTGDTKQGSAREATAAGGYRGGTRKGLDLTVGGPAQLTDASKDLPRGGALLRSIRRLSDDKVISGPSLLVDELLRLSSAATIAELVETKWEGDRRAFGPVSSSSLGSRDASLCLVARKQLRAKRPTTYRSPRIGLDLSHSSIPTGSKIHDAFTHPRVLFIDRPYRYYTYPHLLTANGRGQTLLGCMRSSVDLGQFSLETRAQRALSDELVKLTGLKAQTVLKYLDEYRTGKEDGALEGFIGAKGKGAGSSPVPFMRLMGILERVRTSQ